jgi:hypothetical protein
LLVCKIAKSIVCLVMFDCLIDWLLETSRLAVDKSSWNWSVKRIQPDKNNGRFVRLWQCVAEFLLEWQLCRKKSGENQNTYFIYCKYFPTENRTVCEIMWKSMVQPDSPQTTTWYGECAWHTV